MDPWTTKQVNMALIKKAAWRFMWTDKHKHPLLRCSCNQLSKHLPSSISLGSNLQSRHCDCWASSSVMATVKKELCVSFLRHHLHTDVEMFFGVLMNGLKLRGITTH